MFCQNFRNYDGLIFIKVFRKFLKRRKHFLKTLKISASVSFFFAFHSQRPLRNLRHAPAEVIISLSDDISRNRHGAGLAKWLTLFGELEVTWARVNRLLMVVNDSSFCKLMYL